MVSPPVFCIYAAVLPVNQVKYTTGENPKATEGMCFYGNDADVMR